MSAQTISASLGVVARLSASRLGSLRFVGGASGLSDEVSPRSQIRNLLAGNLNQTQVDSQISTRLADYAIKTYVDTKDADLADSAFIDAADSTRLNKANLNKAGYPFTLDSTGKVPASKVKIPSLQKYPNVAVAASGNGGTTSSETSLFSLSVPDPGYPYKLLVTGTVSATVSADNGSRPQVTVYRGDGAAVAVGYGISEAYGSLPPDTFPSRMYATAYTPPAWPNVVNIPNGLLNTSITYTSDWQNLPWIGVSTDPYTTTVSGPYMQAASSMSNVTLSAIVSYANGAIPRDALGNNVGRLTAEIRIYSSVKGVVVVGSPSTGRTVSGTLTAQATGLSIVKGELLTVQVKQTMYCPWGKLGLGDFATWAPAGSGTSNTLTLTPGLTSTLSGGEITIMPMTLTSQSPITGPTIVSVSLQSPGGSSVTAQSVPGPRIMAIPIPA